MTTMTNYALAQRGAHTQRPSDQRYKSRETTGQVPARLEDKASRDFMRYYAQATDRDTRLYCGRQLQRLGVPWVIH